MKRTRKFLFLSILFTLISIGLTVGPAAYYIILAFNKADVVIKQSVLVSAIFVAVIGSLICLINKNFTFRSRVWIFLLAVMYCVGAFKELILVFAVTQILDELIIAPLARHFRSKYSINKEIDKRERSR